MRTIDLNTRIIDLTIGELLEYIKPQVAQQPSMPVKCDENIVYGIDGIAKLLGVSKSTVWQYRNEGWLEPAIKQTGRKIICDAALALELFGKRK
ncbi:MAG: DUF3853 family protein [Tannerellaceae bacterium]|jgi:hypothetical protein|nr:DUF3853 family protein [Tannerellaceae bacterium]